MSKIGELIEQAAKQGGSAARGVAGAGESVAAAGWRQLGEAQGFAVGGAGRAQPGLGAAATGPAAAAAAAAGQQGVWSRVLGSVRSVPGRLARPATVAAAGAALSLDQKAVGLFSGGSKVLAALMVGDGMLKYAGDFLGRKIFGDHAVDVQNLAMTGHQSILPDALKMAAAGVAVYGMGRIVRGVADRSGRGLVGTLAHGVGSVGAAVGGAVGAATGGRVSPYYAAQAAAALGVAGLVAVPALNAASRGPGEALPVDAPARMVAAEAPGGRARGETGPGVAGGAVGGAGAVPAVGVLPLPEDVRFSGGPGMKMIDAGTAAQIARIDGLFQAGKAAIGLGQGSAEREAARPVLVQQGMRSDGSSFFLMGRREAGPDGRIAESFVAQAGPDSVGMSASLAERLPNGVLQRTVRVDGAAVLMQSDMGMQPGGEARVVINAAGQRLAAELGAGVREPDPVAGLLARGGLKGVQAQTVQTMASSGVEASSVTRFSGMAADGSPVLGHIELSAGRARVAVLGRDGKPEWVAGLPASDVLMDQRGRPQLGAATLAGLEQFVADPAALRDRLSRVGVAPADGRLVPPNAEPAASASLRGDVRTVVPSDVSQSGATEPVRQAAVVPPPAGVRPVNYVVELPADVAFSKADGRRQVVTASLPAGKVADFVAEDPRVAAGMEALGMGKGAPDRPVAVAEGRLGDGSSYFAMGYETSQGSRRLTRSVYLEAGEQQGLIAATKVVGGSAGIVSKTVVGAEPGLVGQTQFVRAIDVPTKRVAVTPEGGKRLAGLVEANERPDPVVQGLMSGGLTQLRGSVTQVAGTDGEVVVGFAGRGRDGKEVAGRIELANGYGRMAVLGADGKTVAWSKALDGAGVRLDRMGNVELSGRDAAEVRLFSGDPLAVVEKEGPRSDRGRVMSAESGRSFASPPRLAAREVVPPAVDPDRATGVAALIDVGRQRPQGLAVDDSRLAVPALRDFGRAPSGGRLVAGGAPGGELGGTSVEQRAGPALLRWSALGSARDAPAPEAASGLGRGPGARVGRGGGQELSQD